MSEQFGQDDSMPPSPNGTAPEQRVGCSGPPARTLQQVCVVSTLDAASGPAHQELTWARFRPLLGQITRDGRIVAVGAARFGRPIGLALGRVEADALSATILSVMVRPGYRGIGVGMALIEALEQALSARRCIYVSLTYLTDTPSRPILERLLQRRGWDAPRPGPIPPRAGAGIACVVGKALYSGDGAASSA